MARGYDGSASYDNFVGTPPQGDTPSAFSVSCWIYTGDSSQAGGAIWSIGKTGASNQYWTLETDASSQVVFRSRSGGSATAVTSNTVSINTWHHIHAVQIATDDRQVWLDADDANKGTDGTSKTQGTMNRWTAGALVTSGGASGFWAGRIAELATWNSAITTLADIEALAGGCDPRLIQPGGITAYHNMIRDAEDWLRVFGMTGVGSPSVEEHVPMYYKRSRGIFVPASAGGLSLVRFGNDTVNVADAVQPKLELLRFGNDTEQIADGLLRARDMVRAIDETEEIADDLPHVLGLLRTVDENEEVADGVLSVLGIVRALDATVNVADGLQHQLELLRFGDDTEELADGVTRPMALTRFDDTVEQIADDAIRPMDMVRVFDTVEELADTSTDSLGLLRFGDDDVNIADGVLSILGIVRFADDTMNIADAVQHQLELLRFGDDDVNVADALVRVRAMVRVLDSTLNIADAEVRAMAMTRALADTVQVADELLHLLGLLRFTPDSIELADALQRTFGLIRAIDETEQIADAALEKVTPTGPGLGPQFANTVEEIADDAIFARVMVRPGPAEVVNIATGLIGQIGTLEVLAATVNVGETLVPVCKPVASFGVLKIYDGTQWVAGPEFFAS